MPDPVTSAVCSAPATVCEAFQRTVTIMDPAAVALRSSDGTLTVDWAAYGQTVRRAAAGLAASGIRRGDVVALMAANRPEISLCDMAALHLGATPFSVYRTLAVGQLAHVLGDADPRLVVCEARHLGVLAEAGVPSDRLVVLDEAPDGPLTWEGLLARGEAEFDFEGSWRAVGPDDVATLIYTSGTTGPSKGVTLTHRQILAQVAATTAVWTIRGDDTSISFLPTAHIADRVFCHYAPAVHGGEVVFVADMRQLPGVLREVRPTVLGAVPRVWEKIKAGVEQQVAADADPGRAAEITRAFDLARGMVAARLRGEQIPADLIVARWEAEARVLGPLRRMAGLGRVRLAMCGAAPVDPGVLEWVMALGLEICEGWGMSEVAGMGLVNPPGRQRLGSVGQPIPGLEVRLADDGELQVRGTVVTAGYRNLPEETARAFTDDGWLNTGDIAQIDADGYVRIVDRKKELLINAAGKNLSPIAIELAVATADPLIGPMVAIADGRPYTTALITLEPDAAARLAADLGLPDAHPATLAADQRVRERVADAVAEGNRRLSRVEQIKRHHLLDVYWSPGGEELTPTLKTRRKAITAKYADQIDALYAQVTE
ncbi:long-chain fatty acid--CoA ligase [Streptosporangium sp. NPDC051023]|uniref:AMP-dependent synthetase/ligase n=1 Tax=Streptosporangium sp. NPDC051023 TaxID=3155410 RepID=UPI00344CB8AD